jgi:hypothetical protein
MTNAMAKAAANLFLALALTSCASVSVEEGTTREVQKMPEIIYVTDFETTQADFEVDRSGKELAEFKKNLQLMLKTGVAADLTDKLVPAAAVEKRKQSGLRNSWLVRGEFIKVEQGSRALRSVFGYGAGATKLETKVEVYDLEQGDGTPFLTFSTTGGSGAEPGALAGGITTDPLQLAIGGVSGAAHGLSEDTARTAREITAEISDYMYKHGWIPEDQWIKPKHQRNTDSW